MMVDATKEIVLKWQTKRFAGSRAKEWPAWKLKMQGLCFGCGAPGHIKMDCPKKNAQRSLESSWRWKNLRGGKKARDRRGFGDERRNTWRNFGRPFEGKCHTCNRKGHKAKYCRQHNKASEKHKEIAARGNEECQRESSESARWIVDSRCSYHMVKSSEGLSNIQWGKGRVQVAGGRVLKSVGIGSIVGAVRAQDGETKRVVFKDVRIVPELGGRSLLSVQRIVSLGGKVTFSLSNADIEMNGVKLPMRSNGDDLYELEYQRLDTGMGGAEEQAFMADEEDAKALGISRRSGGGHRKKKNYVKKSTRQESGKMNVEVTSFSVTSDGIGKAWCKRKVRRKHVCGDSGRGGSNSSSRGVRHVSRHWKRRNLASVGDRRADEHEEYEWESAIWKSSARSRQRCRQHDWESSGTATRRAEVKAS